MLVAALITVGWEFYIFSPWKSIENFLYWSCKGEIDRILSSSLSSDEFEYQFEKFGKK